MTYTEQLQRRFEAMPPEKREAWALRTVQQIDAEESNDWFDSLTPEQHEWLKAELQRAVEEADRGELVPAGEMFDRLDAKYARMAEERGA